MSRSLAPGHDATEAYKGLGAMARSNLAVIFTAAGIAALWLLPFVLVALFAKLQ